MKPSIWIGIVFCITGILVSCVSGNESDKKFKIGFSQCTGGDSWRRQMLADIQGELTFHQDLEIEYRDAVGNTDKQIYDIEGFIRAGIDLLIVSPNEADPITPVIEKAFRAGIPVIIVDRRTSSSLYTAYIGANNYEIGKLAGEYIAGILGGKGKVIEVVGLQGSSPATDRHNGFSDAIKKYSGISIVDKVEGMWEVDTARHEMERKISTLPEFDLVFAHNDMMAYGTYEVLKYHHMVANKMFVGVDGLPGPGAGIQLVDDNILTATFLYPTGGEDAIRLASRILHKEPYEKENILHSTVIDRRNVRVMKLQTDRIQAQQADIIRQQEKINKQISTYYNQRILIYILLTCLVVMIIIGALAVHGWREKIEINRRLENNNNKIIEQRNKIAEMADKTEANTREKLRFFTNISHEFRTPLTLILLSIEELLSNSAELKFSSRENLSAIKRNAVRLLRLINQLMDFRKIEDKKMKIQASEQDIVKFIRDVMTSFEKMAVKRKIDFRLNTEIDALKVWFDRDKLDKVVFNLLSNAFKFTKDEGKIHVTVSVSEKRDEAIIFFEDTGIGMTKEHLAHAFDQFYTGENPSFNGIGLGLSLSKEYIELHHGKLTVSSEKWKGTRFCIQLLLGKAHLESDEFAPQDNVIILDPNYVVGMDEPSDTKEGIAENYQINQKSILLIDDNLELITFMKSRLESSYNVVIAYDGTMGLQKAFEIVPDLVICDILLPGKSGIEVTKILKSDLRTSHIPIIILSARSAPEQKIEGIKIGADEYFTKPFIFEFLIERIKALIRSRETLKDHYSHDINIGPQIGSPGQLDRRFINDFKVIVEKNIGNVDFNVNDISREMGMSRIQIYRKVNALFGYSIHDFLINVRLKKAKKLLLETEMPISEIATAVGFSSSAYFSTAFKNKLGMTPKDFKSQRLAKS